MQASVLDVIGFEPLDGLLEKSRRTGGFVRHASEVKPLEASHFQLFLLSDLEEPLCVLGAGILIFPDLGLFSRVFGLHHHELPLL